MSLEWARARARENEERLRRPAEEMGRARLVQHPIGPLRVVLIGALGRGTDVGGSCAERLGVAALMRSRSNHGEERSAGVATGT
jgi:hypothetical protein